MQADVFVADISEGVFVLVMASYVFYCANKNLFIHCGNQYVLVFHEHLGYATDSLLTFYEQLID